MVALVQNFVDVITILWTFVQAYLIPTDVASITILHVAIWTPVVLGLITLVIGTIKGMFKGGGRKKAA